MTQRTPLPGAARSPDPRPPDPRAPDPRAPDPRAPDPRGPARASRPSRLAARRRAGLWFVLPALLAYLLLVALPVLATLGLSFTSRSGAGRPAFAAFGNYARLLGDDAFRAALGRTLAMALAGGASAALGLALALLLRPGERGPEPVRAALAVPAILSPAVAGAAWGGLLGTGAGGAPFPVIVLAAIWSSLGLGATVALAGLRGTDPEQGAAARAEGLSDAQSLRLVALPRAAPLLAVTAAAMAIGGLGSFGLPWAMAGGGPGEAAVLAAYAVEAAVLEGDQGRGAATGIVLAALSLLIAWAALRLRARLA